MIKHENKVVEVSLLDVGEVRSGFERQRSENSQLCESLARSSPAPPPHWNWSEAIAGWVDPWTRGVKVGKKCRIESWRDEAICGRRSSTRQNRESGLERSSHTACDLTKPWLAAQGELRRPKKVSLLALQHRSRKKTMEESEKEIS